ncbi:Ig-like domain-containing protein [Beggiatoa alba B18LD]|uniref:Ig-like domain-containing protein n=1 Tax=Beggiatoa alba B18LD TaxID=395493 RepID=I3CD61_9GAMM|nr:Ig-like domain-containing protein [Beggiatoa alba]EIJ41554.1 Ig-like domain-containing protein [Beggiatoa alba B18LD]
MSKLFFSRLLAGIFLCLSFNAVFATETSVTMTDAVGTSTTAGEPTQIIVFKGAKQTVPIGVKSLPIIFKVLDEHGMPVTGVTVNFALQRNGSPVAGTGLSKTSTVTDIVGQAVTHVQATTVTGNYTVTAILPSNLSLLTSTTLKIVTTLPSLGNGGGVGADGKPSNTGSLFGGGISINDGEFVKKGAQKLDDKCLIQGVITTDTNDIGKQVDFIVVAAYVIPELNFSTFFMLDEEKGILSWDLDITKLSAFQSNQTLEDKQIINIYEGFFVASGQLLVFYGYRLPNGKVVFNAEQVIDITITE